MCAAGLPAILIVVALVIGIPLFFSALLQLIPLLLTATSAVFGFPESIFPVQRQRDLLLLQDETDAESENKRKAGAATLKAALPTRHGVGYNLGTHTRYPCWKISN